MIEPTQFDWAKLAAYIDGEGSICVNSYWQKNKKYTAGRLHRYRLMVQVTNTDLRLMNWLSERFSGAVTFKCPAGRNNQKRDCYVWICYQPDIHNVLMNCLEHFVMKRHQAETALLYLKFFSRVPHTNRVPAEVLSMREECRTKLRVLNGKAA